MSKEKKPESEVITLPKVHNLPNILYVRLSEKVFKRVYAIANETNSNMSEVARLCIESKLVDVEKLYKEIKELRSGFTKR